MRTLVQISIVALAVTAAGCSSSSSGGATSSTQAPMLTKVEPMAGALHITWMNMSSDCDSVEAERMMGTASYAPSFSVPGTVDNKMDTTATDDMMYMYRRCKKGGTYSDYSNEMSANPHMVDGGTGDGGH